MFQNQRVHHEHWTAARSRVGTTPIEKLRWLLRWGLEQKPLGQGLHSRGEDLNWQYDWTVFIEDHGGSDIGPPPEIVSELAALDWKQRVRSALRSFQSKEPWVMQVKTEYRIDCTGNQTITVEPVRDEGDRIAKKIVEIFDLLGDQIRFCQRSDCQKLFERKKGKRYCSPSCAASKFRVRKHREKKTLEKVRAKEQNT